jgi:hypothetical protein
MVGAKGFEPSTSWSRTRRASQAALRPDRTCSAPQRLERNHNISIAPQHETRADNHAVVMAKHF